MNMSPFFVLMARVLTSENLPFGRDEMRDERLNDVDVKSDQGEANGRDRRLDVMLKESKTSAALFSSRVCRCGVCLILMLLSDVLDLDRIVREDGCLPTVQVGTRTKRHHLFNDDQNSFQLRVTIF